MTSAWSPITPSFLSWFGFPGVFPRRFGRVPHAAVREVLHHHVFVGATQLAQCGEEFFFVLGAEGGGLVVDQDGPVHIAGRHGSLYRPLTWLPCSTGDFVAAVTPELKLESTLGPAYGGA